MSSAKLKVGLLLDDLDVSAWEREMIEGIVSSDCAEVCLVVVNDLHPQPVEKSLWERAKSNSHRLGSVVTWKTADWLYQNLVDRHQDLPDAERTESARALLADVPRLVVRPEQGKWSDRFPEADLQQLREHDLDVLVRCGFRILRGGVLSAARYGVWSFHHGDNRVNRGGPPGFWESLEGWPETGSILQILTEDLDNGRVLYRSWSCTDAYSVRDNRNRFRWKSQAFVLRKLRELHRDGPERFFERVDEDNRAPEMYSERLFKSPTAFHYLRLTLARLWAKARLMFEKQFYFEQWALLFSLRDDFASSLWRYERLMPPKDRFWADPFVLRRDGRYYIFIEELLYGADRGHIAVIEMDDTGRWTQPVKVLERPYHLSYPFVFEHEGDLFMIPESAQNRTVELYRCVEFPHRWAFEMNLMEDIHAVDATLLQRGGKWWLFANVVETEGASSWDELHVFHAADFRTSEWTAHPRNPVISDCKRSRPAGAFFEHEGRLYRPSQNCSVRYGYGFNFSEVLVLDESDYAERLVTAVEPNWDGDVLGTHTFNRAGRLHVSDVTVKRRK